MKLAKNPMKNIRSILGKGGRKRNHAASRGKGSGGQGHVEACSNDARNAGGSCNGSLPPLVSTGVFVGFEQQLLGDEV